MKTDFYQVNMQALEERYPALAEKIKNYADIDEFKIDIIEAGDYAVFQKLEDKWVILCGEKQYSQENVFVEMNSYLEKAKKIGAGIVFYGLDAGLRLIYAFDRSEEEWNFFVIERHVEVLKALLRRGDLRHIIESERVFFFIGEDALIEAINFIDGFMLNPPLVDLIFCSRRDQELYFSMRTALSEKIKQAYQEAIESKRFLDNHYHALTRKDLDGYFNSSSRPLRIMGELSAKTKAMQHVTRVCMQGFKKNNHQTYILASDTGVVSCNYFYKVLKRFLPDVFFKINHTSRESYEWDGLITASWIQDYMPYVFNPDIPAYKKIGSYDQVFAMTKFIMRDLEKAGFPRDRLHLLYFASDTDLYRPMRLTDEEKATYGCDISFVCHYPDFHSVYSMIPKEAADAIYNQMVKEDAYYIDDFNRIYGQAQEKVGAFSLNQEACAILRQSYGHIPDELIASLYVWSGLGSAALRIPYLEAIKDKKLYIYGEGWQQDSRLAGNARGKVSYGEELCKVCNAAKININLHIGSNNHSRVFDTIASGGFMLTRFAPEDEGPGGIGDLFEIGNEIEVFRTREEMREKIDYYLSHEDERRQIAERGRERLLRDHTIEKRMQQVLDIVYNGLRDRAE